MECGESTVLRPLAEVAYGAVADSGPPMVIGGRTSDTALFVIHGPHILDEMKLFVPQCPQRIQARAARPAGPAHSLQPRLPSASPAEQERTRRETIRRVRESPPRASVWPPR